MIVAIDGPAGAGKSSVSRTLAQRLGFHFLDTGAMYRAVAWAALEQGLNWAEPDQLAALARQITLEMADDGVFVNGREISREIRTVAVTNVIRHAADNVAVRAHLVALQQALGRNVNLVTEGRDQGTVAFPHAECKIFLTASAEERARRRVDDLAARGESATLAEVLAAINERDQQDMARPVGALRRAPDAVEVCTNGLTPAQVVNRLEAIVRERQRQLELPLP